MHLIALALVAGSLSLMLDVTHVRAQSAQPHHAGSIAIVVGWRSRIDAVNEDVLREFFLRRRRSLGDGGRVTPVNLAADHPVRRKFSKLILGRFPTELASYWDKLYYQGIPPPAVLSSPEAVCEYVGHDPLAIGYVPFDSVGDGCRVILTIGR